MLTHFVLRKVFSRTCPGFVYFGHGVTSKSIGIPRYSRLHLNMKYLKRDIYFWKKLGFSFISYETLERIVLGELIPKNPWIHITLDDGYKNNLTVALPLFERMRTPFTVFITVNNVLEKSVMDNHMLFLLLNNQFSQNKYAEILKSYFSTNSNTVPQLKISDILTLFKYLIPSEKQDVLKALKANAGKSISEMNKDYPFEEMLSQEELIMLSKSKLVNIGSHGFHHNILTTLNSEEVKYEMLNSKRVLEEALQKEVPSYCYPNGTKADYNAEIMNICKESGYKTAFTTNKLKWKSTDSPYAIPRIPLSYKSPLKKAVKIIY